MARPIYPCGTGLSIPCNCPGLPVLPDRLGGQDFDCFTGCGISPCPCLPFRRREGSETWKVHSAPFFISLLMVSVTASVVRSAATLVTSACLATAAMSSAFVIVLCPLALVSNPLWHQARDRPIRKCSVGRDLLKSIEPSVER